MRWYHRLMYRFHSAMLDSLTNMPEADKIRNNHEKRLKYHLERM